MYSAYIEAVLLENFLMNVCVLWCTARIGQVCVRRWRLCISALFGAVYACLALSVPFFMHPAVKWCCAPMMAVILLAPLKLRKMAFLTLVLIGVSFLLGGALYAILAAFEGAGGVSVWMVLTAAIAGVYLAERIPRWARRYARGAKSCVRVRIWANGQEAEFSALLDTGHTLREPVSGEDAAVCAYEAVQGLLTQEQRMSETARGLRWVPYRSVGGRGVLPAIRAERASVQIDGVWRELPPLWVAVTRESLGNEGEWQALLPFGIEQEGQQ